MKQYFGEKKEENIIYFKNEDLNHIKNVMRSKEDDEIFIVIENKRYLCKINKDLKSAEIIKTFDTKGENQKIIFYIPIVNEDKMDFVLQKGTELGVTDFIPTEYKNCKFSFNKEQKEKKINRWNKIIKNASEQCHRISIPSLSNIIDSSEIQKCDGVNILCSLDKQNVKSIKEVLTEKEACDTISVLYGPEGGFTKEEEKEFECLGYVKTSLGNTILRTETVIVYVSSIIMYLKGEQL